MDPLDMCEHCGYELCNECGEWHEVFENCEEKEDE